MILIFRMLVIIWVLFPWGNCRLQCKFLMSDLPLLASLLAMKTC